VKLITLTTDFGTRDWFVGTMKGVIAGIAPETKVIDLTHDIPAGDILGGAFSLLCSYGFCPPGSIHLVVIDPGVGSRRKPIAVKTTRDVFVGPDNGVLSLALRKERVSQIRRLANPAYFLKRVSNTFHGRDIFSPVAAHLSRGAGFESLGPLAKDFLKLDWRQPKRAEGRVEGKVVYIDRFGNGITNIPNPRTTKSRQWCKVQANGSWTVPFEQFYQAVPTSAAVALPGSSGWLEVAVNGGSAEQLLGLRRGCRVSLESEHRRG